MQQLGMMEHNHASTYYKRRSRFIQRIEWDHSNAVQRKNAFVQQLGGLLGLTSQQLDQLFIAAEQL